MPKIESCDKLLSQVRGHLVGRLHDRSISLNDPNELRKCVEKRPEVPETDWYKDLGSVKLCGNEPFPKTWLLTSQVAKREKL